ncbi:MAG: oxalate/formate MFS antiporter [Elusimicrobia bacterium]|nr:oxalate/formate MFS antiporter [Elusimicrobiota bacterium]
MNQQRSWWKLVPCVIAIMAVANLQYTWTLFAKPLMEGLGAKLSAVQLGFTLYIVAQTWLAPFEGWLADRFAPRRLAAAGGLLVGVNWIGAGLAQSLPALYASCALGGFGCGVVMSAGGRVAIKSFPGRRGLAVGVVSMAYGLGPVLAVVPIQRAIEAVGYRGAFIRAGAVQAVLVLAAAFFMPAGGERAAREAAPPAGGRTPWEMVRAYPFVLMYAIMSLVAFGGLMITAQLAPLAESFGIGKTALLFGMGAVPLAIIVDRIMNAASRPFWGGISDRLGRADAMAAAFACESLAVGLLILSAGHPLWFVIQSGLTFFAWGEIFSLFPTTIADVFGEDYAMTNYGVLFTSKGVASLFAGWGAAWLVEAQASWVSVLWIALACDVAAAALAWFFLKPAVAAAMSGSREVPA